MITPVRLFRFEGHDRAAVVSVEPSSWGEGRWMVRVARGASFDKLTSGTTFGPFLEDELANRFDEAVDNLMAEGFGLADHLELLERLKNENPAERAQAALLLGWRRATSAVAPILSLTDDAIDEVCSFVDALGMIGDDRALPLARKMAARKLLSRRRSGVEALRAMGDSVGLAQARQRGLERLPEEVASHLMTLDESDDREANISPLVNAMLEVDVKKRGLVIDTLYEAGTPATTAAARSALSQLQIGRPHLWRYTKSVFKRSMLRHDAETFGWLAHRIERTSWSYKGAKGKVRSGYDGKKRVTTIFNRKTVDWVRRSAWRYLRRLAFHRPELYSLTAAEALIHYEPGDAKVPKGFAGAWADCYLLNRILWGRSQRFRFDSRSMRFRFRSVKEMQAGPKGREEPFPHLWDAHPKAFLRLVSASLLPEVQRFGLAGVRRHPEVLREATGPELVGMLDSDSSDIVDLAVAELERRFELEDPDFELIEALLAHSRDTVWSLACRWLENNINQWLGDVERVVGLLDKATGASLMRLTEITVAALAGASVEIRRPLAERLLELLRAETPSDDLHQGFAIVAREALVAELDELLDTEALLELISTGSNPAKTVAATVLGQRAGGLDALGFEGVISLAESEVLAVRQAAHALLRSGREGLKDDPSVLFALAESEWTDNHEAAFELLREVVGFERLGLDGVIGLCDSTQPDVQAFGREMIQQHFEELDAQDVLFRLVEHPDQQMQKYALELIRSDLKGGFVPLARIESFCRDCLFDLFPDRSLKHGLLEFLTDRALSDERQGELVAGLLDDVVRSHTKADFERVAEALVRIQLAWPEVTSDLSLVASRSEA